MAQLRERDSSVRAAFRLPPCAALAAQGGTLSAQEADLLPALKAGSVGKKFHFFPTERRNAAPPGDLDLTKGADI